MPGCHWRRQRLNSIPIVAEANLLQWLFVHFQLKYIKRFEILQQYRHFPHIFVACFWCAHSFGSFWWWLLCSSSDFLHHSVSDHPFFFWFQTDSEVKLSDTGGVFIIPCLRVSILCHSFTFHHSVLTFTAFMQQHAHRNPWQQLPVSCLSSVFAVVLGHIPLQCIASPLLFPFFVKRFISRIRTETEEAGSWWIWCWLSLCTQSLRSWSISLAAAVIME